MDHLDGLLFPQCRLTGSDAAFYLDAVAARVPEGTSVWSPETLKAKIDAIEKKPATRELINWIRALRSDPDFKPKQLAEGEFPYLGVLFKKSHDYQRAQAAINGGRLN